MEILQTSALPLGHDARDEIELSSERRDSNPRPSRWQRDALPAELLSLRSYLYKKNISLINKHVF